MRFKIIKGMKFGKLTAISPFKKRGTRGTFWRCQCECGNSATAYSSHLKYGYRNSCGCNIGGPKKHGRSHSVEYRTWSRMKERCYNPNNRRYRHYGGRGIEVCKRWKDSFTQFLLDMGMRPGPKYTLERIDNNGNYEPSNCKWADYYEQNNNRSLNRHVAMDDVQLTVSQASRLTGIPHATILSRLDAGYSDKEAISHAKKHERMGRKR